MFQNKIITSINVWQCSIFIVLCVLSINVRASATESDYIPCQKIAIETLRHCLASQSQKSGGKHKSNTCWKKSKQNYDRCLTDVTKSYDPDEIAKARAARVKAERAIKKSVEDNNK